MSRILPYLAALAIVVPAAIVQGTWTGRWVPTEAFDARLEALRQIPLKVGDWTGRDIVPEARTWERAGVAGGLMRSYEKRDGSAVTVMIVCGHPGPTSVHTPEICYAGAGYEAATDKSKVLISGDSGRGDEFWTSDFQKVDSTTPEYLRIFHAWSMGDGFRASSNPRVDFSGAKALYKLYFVRQMSRIDGPPADDPALIFARRFLPEATTSLRSPR